jgi:two-component system NtrC family response regulator
VPELVQALQKRLVHPKHVTEEALAFLAMQMWPGNVRQLAAVVERASAAADDDTIGIDDVMAVAGGMKGLSSRPASFPGPAKVQVARGQLEVETEALRQRLFEQALAESDHNVAAAARHLGVGRMVLMRWLQKQKAR